MPLPFLKVPRLLSPLRAGSRLLPRLSPRNLILALLLSLIVGLSGALYWTRLNASQAAQRVSEYQGTIQSLETALAAQERASRALTRTITAERTARRAAEARASESNNALQQAITANPDWSSQPVPDDVAEWVLKH